jgi:UrcA family protein
MRKFVVSALASLALAGIAPVAAATGDVTLQVKYSDLNLASAEGIEALEARIETAVKAVCAKPEIMRELKSMQAWESCKADATAKAMAQLEKTVELASL